MATAMGSCHCLLDDGDVCSAAKDVRVWSTETLQLLYTLSTSGQTITAAISRDAAGPMPRDTLYAGCAGKIRYWLWPTL